MAGLGNVLSNLNKWAEEKRIGVKAVADVEAVHMQNYARERAHNVWHKQSGNARAGLHGGSFWESPTVLKIFIAHGMSYGVYLELAHDRKYQLLEEVINKFKDDFYNNVKKLMDH